MTRPATVALTRFSNRYRHGSLAETRLDRVLERLGVRVFPFGLSVLEPSLIQRLVSLSDPASLFARYLPDRLCLWRGKPFFCEIKSAITQSDFFSLNLAEYRYQLQLFRAFRVPILVVFDNFPIRAGWIHRLPISRVVEDASQCNGSGKGFVLVPKRELLSLETFFKGVLHEQNDQTQNSGINP